MTHPSPQAWPLLATGIGIQCCKHIQVEFPPRRPKVYRIHRPYLLLWGRMTRMTSTYWQAKAGSICTRSYGRTCCTKSCSTSDTRALGYALIGLSIMSGCAGAGVVGHTLDVRTTSDGTADHATELGFLLCDLTLLDLELDRISPPFAYHRSSGHLL